MGIRIMSKLTPTLVLWALLLAGCTTQETPDHPPWLYWPPPTGFENFASQRLDPDWLLAVGSWRDADGEPTAEFRAWRRSGDTWDLALREPWPGGYNARLEIQQALSYPDPPLILVFVQYGAALEDVYLYQGVGANLVQRQSLEAGAFAWGFRDQDRKSLLVAIPVPGIRINPTYHAWNGERLVPLAGDPHRQCPAAP